MEDYIKAGYITARRHPSLPLTIYNYTKKAQFEGYWNETTRKCRGLVLDDDGEVIVNAPPKFFNRGESYAPKIFLPRAIITEKLDGYYISVTKSSKYGLIVTSRGSFTSKYVTAAQKFITPAVQENLLPDISYFCELLQDFPGDEDTIVMRHPEPLLVCWAIRTQDGEELSPPALSPFPFAQRIGLSTLKSYLEDEVEGVVAFDQKKRERVKIKTAWWLERHKMISGFSKRKIWEIMKNGDLVSEKIDLDELLPQAMTWERELNKDFHSLWTKVLSADDQTNQLTDKELGLLNDYQDLKKYLFLLRKDKIQECLQEIWKAIKPKESNDMVE